MKKIIYIFLFIPLMINLAACYDDMGNYDYTDLPDIDIKIQDTVYATQFKTLELTADVDLNDAPESDYEFNWRIWSNDIGGVWEQKEIGNSRNLTYEVAEVPGSYTLVLTVTNKKTEVQTYKQIYLAVQGSITEGWMVLQEREGKTDFDLIMSPYFSNRVENTDIQKNNYAQLLPGELFEQIEKQSVVVTPVSVKSRGTQQQVQKTSVPKITVDKAKTSRPIAVKEVKVNKQETVPAPVAAKSQANFNHPFHIIVAGGISMKDAEAMANQLKEKGFAEAKALNTAGKVRVSIRSFDNREEATKQLLELRKNETYKNAWLLAK